ncbi:MAG: hypothetical protein RJQ00_12575 [Vicingaceae bacterium]
MKKHYILAILTSLYIVLLCYFSKIGVHLPYGDGVEYVLITESFVNHGSPDLRGEDAAEYMAKLNKKGLEIHRKGDFIKTANVGSEGVTLLGYFPSLRNNKIYGYHFWFYSLLAAPARLVLEQLDEDIRLAHLATNLFFIFLALWVFLTYSKFTWGEKIVFSLLFLFSPILWYIDWAHTEVYSGVLVFVAIFYYYTDRKYITLLLVSLASLQNQALFVLALLVFIELLIKNGLGVKNLLKLFFSSFWIIIPLCFYYYHFNDFSLINNEGYIDVNNISLKRLWSFFFDLNQGMIIGFPLIFFLLVGLLIKDLIQRRVKSYYMLLASILLMSLLIMQTTNWNHGSSVINRYTVWCSVIIVVVLFFRIRNWKKMTFYKVSSVIIISQVFIITQQIDYSEVKWHANHLNKLSKYIFANYPGLYNPEPQIFMGRVSLYELSSTDSVRTYTNDSEEIVKMLVKEGALDQLKLRGINPSKVDSLKEQVTYYQGYAYINKDDLNQLGYVQSKDEFIPVVERKKVETIKKNYADRIKADPDWFNQVKISAENENVSVDSIMTRAVDYVYQLDYNKFEKNKRLSD